jgi:glutathione peroxidase
VDPLHYRKFKMNILFLCFFAVAIFANPITGLTDNHDSCEFWANAGECTKNPNYMLSNCKKSCAALKSDVKSQKTQSSSSFYDIVETDLHNKPVSFKEFKGKVVYIVNVASHCGYTEENYATFKVLHNRFKNDPFIIILAPCDQFGHQEPGDAVAIENFAKQKEFNGLILSKKEVNGESTRPSFKILKELTGKSYINWQVYLTSFFSLFYYLKKEFRWKVFGGQGRLRSHPW